MGGGASLRHDLSAIVGTGHALAPVPASSYCNADSSGPWRGLKGRAEALVAPADAEQVAAVLAFCHRHGLPLVPRGGGSGVSGGACPTEGGVVCDLSRMKGVLEVSPQTWAMEVQAGLGTAHVHRLARESGLMFPPDPGAAEQSQIGGNVATDAGGPHAFKYGSTGAWVTGVSAVIAPGEIVSLGGACRKDVASYDLKRLLIGSEGTLGVIASVRLRLVPAPQSRLGLVAFMPSRREGCEAVLAALGSGVLPAALDFVEGEALAQVALAYPSVPPEEGGVPKGASFALVAELDGDREQAQAARSELASALKELALRVDAHEDAGAMWRWREGVSGAVAAVRGGKVSEDVVVPVQRLCEMLDRHEQIAASEGLRSCSWGHGGDGNAHATVLVNPSDSAEIEAAERVVEQLFQLVAQLSGSVSGEHGLGYVKREALALQLDGGALALHRAMKRAFDPMNVLNPGKKGV